jgi:DNA-binding NarL/FixJ family response regulator
MDTVRVLVFDDDLVHHPNFLAPTFSGLEHRAAGAFRIESHYRAHADHAIAEVVALTPTLVFMDFQMRGHGDGHLATAALRQRWDHGALPILGISSDARLNRLLLMAGATDSCPKMALPDELPDLFARLLALHG